MVRFAQRNIGSRCTPFACSITYDAPTRRKASICQRHGRARVCLTPMHVGWGCHRLRRKFSGNPMRLMPPTSSPAPPAGTAPPSRVLLRHPRRRLGYPRAHVGRPIFIGRFRGNPTVQVFQRFQGARVRHEKKRWPLRGRNEVGNAAIAAQNSSPGFTEPTLPRRRSGQVPALFRPRPGRTRQLCRPLHSTAAIRKQRRSALASFQRPQTDETGLRSGAPR